jgi:methylenetetrahydrofolate reductase (NADPH)
VHNDFHKSHGLFSLFDGLSVENIDMPYEAHGNGVAESNGVNGADKAGGVENIPSANGEAH